DRFAREIDWRQERRNIDFAPSPQVGLRIRSRGPASAPSYRMLRRMFRRKVNSSHLRANSNHPPWLVKNADSDPSISATRSWARIRIILSAPAERPIDSAAS